jgi:hypothetical protein
VAVSEDHFADGGHVAGIDEALGFAEGGVPTGLEVGEDEDVVLLGELGHAGGVFGGVREGLFEQGVDAAGCAGFDGGCVH